MQLHICVWIYRSEIRTKKLDRPLTTTFQREGILLLFIVAQLNASHFRTRAASQQMDVRGEFLYLKIIAMLVITIGANPGAALVIDEYFLG